MMSRYLGTYFAYKAYAVVRECTLPTVRVQKNGKVSIARYEKVRADLIAINHRHQTVIVETKSCPADFRSDEKWESYLPLCNKFYFAADPKTAEYIRAAIVERKMKGVGVIAVVGDKNGDALTELMQANAVYVSELAHKVADLIKTAVRGLNFSTAGF